MKKLFIIIMCLPFALFAQTDGGVKFEHLANWEAVLTKAKAENKHIFVDCYTTWCTPCKYMTNSVFPLKEVGDVYNKNFVNVKIQMDQTKKDEEWVKSWYSVAEMINKKHAINVYPTFLIFNPDGKIVHRIVGGKDAKGAIDNAIAALNPEKQYYTVLASKAESTNPADQLMLSELAKEAYDLKSAEKFIENYLKLQTDKYSEKNVTLLINNSAQMPTANFAQTLIKEYDKFSKLSYAKGLINAVYGIVYKQDITPIIKANSNKIDMAQIEKLLQAKYPKFSKELLTAFKVGESVKNRNWIEYAKNIEKYINKFGPGMNEAEINVCTWTIFENISDVKILNKAVALAKKMTDTEAGQNPQFLDTYANLLYKTGNKLEAIKIEKLAISKLSGNTANEYLETLKKMEAGEKTW